MKFKNSLLVVTDIGKSRAFYQEVLGLRTITDLGANVTLTGGLSLQSKETWKNFIRKEDSSIVFQGNDAALYFEEDDFDGFIDKLQKIESIEYVHPVYAHDWGQRTVRFYDLDKHIIEVGENMQVVCRRFLDSGLSIEETAERMEVPIKYVKGYMR